MDIGLYNINYKRDVKKIRLWHFLIVSANHEVREEKFNGKLVRVEPGQIITSRIKLSKETGIYDRTLDYILDNLEQKEKKICQQKTNHNRLITILNYINTQESFCQQNPSLNINNPDPRIIHFINNNYGMTFTDEAWYWALHDLKQRILTDYINNYTMFEESRKRQLREYKEKKINSEFEDVMQYLEDLSMANKKELSKDKYNYNRREKARKIREGLL